MPSPSNNTLSSRFSGLLLRWNKDKNRRAMPWKGEKDPYRIWLSEIILQQTRVEQGLKYYQHFIEVYPDIESLAAAPDEQVYKSWEGLGYYSRCRNLLSTARTVSSELGGVFPKTFDEIRRLKGVGPYTASAIASFAFNEPHAVLDGNVFRVLSRIFAIEKPVDTTEGKKYFTALANELLDKRNPGEYNQAIMDFGALICKPSPECDECPFKKNCEAYLQDRVSLFPVKRKKAASKKRWFEYFILEHDGKVAIRQRVEKDIWRELYEFPLIESAKEATENFAAKKAEAWLGISKKDYSVLEISSSFKQQLTHQQIHARFIKLRLNRKTDQPFPFVWVAKKQIGQYAFPRLINRYLAEAEIF
jgi:A/G-specific adenine glycosylase